jgi:two-component system sensor histidine kinase/response regulator
MELQQTEHMSFFPTHLPFPSAIGFDVKSEERKPALLVVDDEAGPRQSLKIVFKNDYDILLASSGEEALEIVREHPVDVAVLDIMMEGMSGTELLAQLKQIDPTIEVVMLTAYETIDTARLALRYGACDYLNKPFDIATMRAAVARASAKHQLSVNLSHTNQKLQRLQSEIRDQKVQQEVIRGRGEIYASVLHDINSPLTVISGFVEMINYSIEDVASLEGERLESVRDDLNKLTQQVSRCFEISRRYLSFLRGSPNEIPKVSITQILSDLRDLLIRHPSAQGHELVVETPDNNLVGRINGTDLLQILLNLTINGFQSSEIPHRVEVSCRILSEVPDLCNFTNSDSSRAINLDRFNGTPPLAAITVADNGPGIAPELVRKMFHERFTTKTAEQGTGLGLSIVGRLVEAANSALIMKTTVGKGTMFTLFVQVGDARR